MRKLWLVVSILAAVAILCPADLWAEGYGTPTMDGVADACYGSPEASDPNTDGGGDDYMDLVDLYVCNDDNYWYFFFTIDYNLNTYPGTPKYVVYIDTDGIYGSGAGTDAWTRNVRADSLHLPEYGLYSWVDNPPYDVNHTQFWSWGGSDWTQFGSLDAVALNTASVSGLEWKIAKSRIDSPDSIWCEVWSTGPNSHHNARDTSNDPPDDWNGPLGDWDTMAYIDVSTLVHQVSGADTVKPKVDEARAVDSTHVDIYFSEAMDTSTAENPANYAINPALSVSAASLVTIDRVRLTTAQQTVWAQYTVTVSSTVKDLAGNPMDPAHNSANFRGYAVAPITFIVVDTLDPRYEPGFKVKGSWDTNDPHGWDPGWGGGALYDLWDDGSHGDATSGDHIWSLLMNMIPDESTHTWNWEVYDTGGVKLDGPWEFWVVDTARQTLEYIVPGGTQNPVTVTFSLDMRGEADTTYTNGISIEGSTPPLDWNPIGNLPLTDSDGDTIYTVDVTFPAGSPYNVEYKYTRNGSGAKAFEYEDRRNRGFRLDDTNPTQVLPTDIWNYYAWRTSQDVTVTFCIDMSQQPESTYTGGVSLQGWVYTPWDTTSPIDWVPGSTPMNGPDENEKFTVDVLFPKGCDAYVEWKCARNDTFPATEWEYESVFNRELIIGDSLSTQVLPCFLWDSSSVVGFSPHQTEISIPNSFSLAQNYPNPFNPTTTIRYQLSAVRGRPSAVSLKIYNILGQEVRTLVDKEQAPGYYSVNWDGRNAQGREVTSGVYFYRLKVGDYAKTMKMVLLK